MLSLCWRAARGRFFTVSLVTMTLGAVLVKRQWGTTLWPAFPLIVLGGLLVHAGANLWNDYADDLNGADRVNAIHTPFNGGSHVIQRGEASPAAIRGAALACLGGALFIAVVLARRGGWGVPVLTLVGIALSLGYSSPPAWFCRHGLGELVVAICFGPLLAEGSALALAGRFSFPVLLASAPLGLLVAAILTLNEIPDRPADASVGKRNVAVRRGSVGAIAAYRIMLAAAFLLTIVGIAAGVLGPCGWLSLCTFPPALLLFHGVGCLGDGTCERFSSLAGGTIALHLAFGLLMLAGILV